MEEYNKAKPSAAPLPRLKKLLRSEIDGCHGESERRVVAQAVLDSLDGCDDGRPVDFAIGVAQSLAEAAQALAGEIDKL